MEMGNQCKRGFSLEVSIKCHPQHSSILIGIGEVKILSIFDPMSSYPVVGRGKYISCDKNKMIQTFQCMMRSMYDVSQDDY